ncbi:MAG: hypothetical protein E7262_03955 [Lachnospiraceae bacterium]|nr:hypothetical protein [Lachnospiraceae bacterium]
MAKKNKTGKLQYQFAFEYRSLKWLVLEIAMFSVFAELAYTYFKVKNIDSKDDVAFAPIISGSLWQIIFYAAMIIGFLSVAYVVFGDRMDFNGMYALRTMPIDIKHIILSKLGVSVVAMLGVYGAQLLSFMFTWSLFTENVPVAKRESHALNYALVKDKFICSSFPATIGQFFINILFIVVMVIGFSYLLYSARTRNSNKILLGGFYFIVNLVAIIVFIMLGVRVPFIPSTVKNLSSDVMIGVSITLVVYIGALGVMMRKMYKEFIYE